MSLREPDLLEKMMKKLKKEYADPGQLAVLQKQKIAKHPTVGFGADNLLDFYDLVEQTYSVLVKTKRLGEEKEFIGLVLTCLPRTYQNRINDALDRRSSVKLLLKAMERLVDRQKDTEWPQEVLGVEKTQKKDEKKNKDEKKKDKKKNDWQKKDKGSTVNSFTTTTQPPTGGQSSSQKNCQECGGQNDLSDCNQFKAIPVNERLSKAKDVFVPICLRCLKKGGRGQCEFTPECPVEGRKCRYNHNVLLHGAVAAKPEKKKEEVVTPTTDVTALTSQAGEQSLRLVKLYVKAYDGDKRTICHMTALLDSGSLTTILQEEVARQLGARLNFEDVAVTTLHGTPRRWRA